MQGSSAATEAKWQSAVANAFGNGGADVVCLQECGGVPPSAVLQFGFGGLPFVGTQPAAGAGTLHGFNIGYYLWGTARTRKHIFWMETDAAAHRVNLAVVTRTAPTHLLSAAPGMVGGRPAIGMRVNPGGGVWDMYSLHAWSGGGNDAASLLTNVFAGAAGSVAALGDYNREPPNLVVPAGTVKCPPVQYTRPSSQRSYDYMVKNVAGSVKGTVLAVPLSDHCMVYFDT
jgi:cytolethal distending toxin subunit B